MLTSDPIIYHNTILDVQNKFQLSLIDMEDLKCQNENPSQRKIPNTLCIYCVRIKFNHIKQFCL